MKKNSAQLITVVVMLWCFLSGCRTSNRVLINNITTTITTSPVFEKNFTGFELYDPTEQKIIYSHNAGKYFNPASNTKLFTFYAALNMLGDSIPGLQYEHRGDSLIFQGTGDPSFLNGDFYSNSKVYDFLKNTALDLYYIPKEKNSHRYGPGWAWDDFNDYYATEKAAFPIYGNVARFYFYKNEGPPLTIPPYFATKLLPDSSRTFKQMVHRKEHENTFYYSLKPEALLPMTAVVPFRYSPTLLTALLSDTLNKPVSLLAHKMSLNHPKTLYSVPADSLYKRMLQVSDNFIAEHILLLCAGVLSDTLESKIAIEYMKKHYLNDFSEELRWIDGSGLSRYNLFTPHSIVKLLEKISKIVPQQRLFELLPAGGKSGNLIDYPLTDQPYIYAKTGTLSNNYCLSGYLLTKSGKTLIFSFMNNNYIIADTLIKNEMKNVLNNIYELY